MEEKAKRVCTDEVENEKDEETKLKKVNEQLTFNERLNKFTSHNKHMVQGSEVFFGFLIEQAE